MNHLEVYLASRKQKLAYQYALWLLSWDQETETPNDAMQYRSDQIEVLSTLAYDVEMDSKRIEAIDYLALNPKSLTEDLKVEIKRVKKDLDQLRKIPKQDYIDFQVLLSQAGHVWSNAKKNNDFASYLPTLEKVISYQKKLVKYLSTDTVKGYDVLLDMYEPGMTVVDYDHFFNTLKTDLVPFVMKAAKVKQSLSRKLTKGHFSKAQQIAFNTYLLDVFKYDQNKGVLKQSAHPFTSGVASVDTRITTAYHEDDVRSAIFSTIHEMGHAIYEQQVKPEYDYTELKGGVSMGIHESQSRFYENMIGRSEAFWDTHYDKLVETFPKELKGVSKQAFIQYINQVKRDFIRVEADELTYSLHVMVRYEIEKQLFNGKLQAKDLPKVWNKLYKKYLGLTPKTDTEGVLQDIHWAFGSFGYFPTYALGSAISAQIYHRMNQDFNIEQVVRNNEIVKINAWLKEHIHQYGKSIEPKALILKATNEAFNPQYYVHYLKEKYSKILGIEA
jgi:carboxypeptidase Taq